MIDRLSIRLLELEFKSNNSIKSKCLKYVVKIYCPNFINWVFNNFVF